MTMTPTHLFVFLLALFASALAQNDDELHIPVENDNQFPPENPSESKGNIIEGSGAGVIDEPFDETTTVSSALLLEDVQLTTLTDNVPTVATKKHLCPEPCVCNVEGDTRKYIVDCSGYQLTEIPKNLDTKTTELNLQNNNITEISKDISALKDLKILNVNNNDIKEIVSGSISELPELTTLKLGYNRLIKYPLDLKNSFGLTKLQELDLGGNDMRTDLKSETFSNFKALRTLTLPTATTGLVEDLCASLKDSLETVCTGSCNSKSFECPDAPQGLEDGLLNYALPGLISLMSSPEETPTDNSTPDVKTENETQENVETTAATNDETTVTPTSEAKEEASPVGNLSRHSKIIKTESAEKSEPIEETASKATTKSEKEVVGATTSGTKTGGVDKSLIGIIVAGMVLVVAGITIKKNWSSIRNRFSSSPRTANDRTTAANGNTPEEVPLQEKSPV